METLFAQKILALFLRPYQKGRDFYDIIWFLSQKKVEPNYEILKEKGFDIKSREKLITELQKTISKLDLKQASKDVERFLFYPEQAKWIIDLPLYLEKFKKRYFFHVKLFPNKNQPLSCFPVSQETIL